MFELHSALPGAINGSDTIVQEAGLCGMVTLRGDLSDAKLRRACADFSGSSFPAPREIHQNGDRGLAWMSPDELLVLCPHDAAPDAVAQLTETLGGQHMLAVNVSDARAVFTISGAAPLDVLARLSPADLRDFGPNRLIRTRVGQVAAAFWLSEENQITLVCFRSVARYVFDLLAGAAQAGPLQSVD